MKIEKLTAREIFDSQGIPAVECSLTLNDGMTVVASAASEDKPSSFEAVTRSDGGQWPFGQGASKAVKAIEGEIAAALAGKEPNLIEIDAQLLALDDGEHAARFGPNALLPVSIAVCRAQAYMHNIEPYELIAHLLQVEHVSLPFPMFSMVNGEYYHQNGGLPIQEYMVVPMGARHFREALEIGMHIFHVLKHVLKHKGLGTAIGDQGGVALTDVDERIILDSIMDAIKMSGYDQNGLITLATKMSACNFYNTSSALYQWGNFSCTSEELISAYASLIKEYPIYSIQDGLSNHDWSGWHMMTNRLAGDIQLVGDSIFATNIDSIIKGLQQGVANAAVVKPHQAGTITETLRVIKFCQEQDLNVVVSHGTGDTNDTIIVDLAVGGSVGQIKAGGCCRGECVDKYNRLLAIEDELTLSLLD